MIYIKENVERHTDDLREAKALEAKGYKLIGDAAPAAPAEAKKLDDMTLKELQTVAKERGIAGYSTLKKEDLLKVLTEEDNGSTNGRTEGEDPEQTGINDPGTVGADTAE